MSTSVATVEIKFIDCALCGPAGDPFCGWDSAYATIKGAEGLSAAKLENYKRKAIQSIEQQFSSRVSQAKADEARKNAVREAQKAAEKLAEEIKAKAAKAAAEKEEKRKELSRHREAVTRAIAVAESVLVQLDGATTPGEYAQALRGKGFWSHDTSSYEKLYDTTPLARHIVEQIRYYSKWDMALPFPRVQSFRESIVVSSGGYEVKLYLPEAAQKYISALLRGDKFNTSVFSF